jgi:hypothetical protein
VSASHTPMHANVVFIPVGALSLAFGFLRC